MNAISDSSMQRECPNPASLAHYAKESRINASPEIVFRFHESPDALRHLIPPWENVTVAESTGSLKPGSKVVLRGRVCCLPVQWVAVHTEYDPPNLFADRQESGPFAWWYHRHRFLPDGQGGTILRDEVEYKAPLGILGRWLGGRLIRRKLERMFAYRHETTRRLIESGTLCGGSTGLCGFVPPPSQPVRDGKPGEPDRS